MGVDFVTRCVQAQDRVHMVRTAKNTVIVVLSYYRAYEYRTISGTRVLVVRSYCQ
jgi:hypothetical protein